MGFACVKAFWVEYFNVWCIFTTYFKKLAFKNGFKKILVVEDTGDASSLKDKVLKRLKGLEKQHGRLRWVLGLY